MDISSKPVKTDNTISICSLMLLYTLGFMNFNDKRSTKSM